MIAYCEFQFEACPQYILQDYIAEFRYNSVRIMSWFQSSSIMLSSFTIVFTLTKVVIPQIYGQEASINHTFLLAILFLTFKDSCGQMMIKKNYYFFSLIIAYVIICNIVILWKDYFNQLTNSGKIKSSMLSLLYLHFTGYNCFYIVDLYLQNSEINFSLYFNFLKAIVILSCNLFFAFIFIKATIRNYPPKTIWIFDKEIISDINCVTLVVLVSIHLLLLVFLFLPGFGCEADCVLI